MMSLLLSGKCALPSVSQFCERITEMDLIRASLAAEYRCSFLRGLDDEDGWTMPLDDEQTTGSHSLLLFHARQEQSLHRRLKHAVNDF